VAVDLTHLMKRIEENAARAAADGRESVLVGPFLATFHPTSDMVWLNHVVPAVAPADRAFTVEHFDGLRRLYREHGRILRFEFLEALWPTLGPALESWGMELQGRMPFMLCGPGDLKSVQAPGVEVQALSERDGDDLLAEFTATAKRSFDVEGGRVEPHEIVEFREALASGRFRSMIGRVDGRMAGVGTMVVRSDELAGVGTLPEFRRRGVAATVNSALVADHFRRGGELAWLSAGNEAAHGVYRKIGFHDAGVQLNYIDR